jgi:hypothetical protein
MEYAGAIWGAMCSPSALQMLEQVQERFGRRLLRLSSNTAGEFVRQELRLESMRERVAVAGFRFFGYLADMPKTRLASVLFHHRCNEVDAGAAASSWCKRMKENLERDGWPDVWRDREVPENWQEQVDKKVSLKFRAESSLQMLGMSSLTVFRQVKAARQMKWLDRVRVHPGAAAREKLRSGTAPLMRRVGAEMRIPYELRVCLMCPDRQIEDAQHFVSRCSHFASMRDRCLVRLGEGLGALPAVQFRAAMAARDPELFLGDRLLAELPAGVAMKVDTVICDFLKVAWRRRQQLWKAACRDGSEWRLRSYEVPSAG